MRKISVDEASKEQQLEAAKATFELVRGEMEKDAKRAAKLEQKCSPPHGRASEAEWRIVQQTEEDCGGSQGFVH